MFELTPKGLQLTEIAPGVDLQSSILDLMETPPIMEEIALMDARLFRAEEMDLRVDLLHLDLPDRIAVSPEGDRLFLNFEKMRVRSRADIVCLCSARRCPSVDFFKQAFAGQHQSRY